MKTKPIITVITLLTLLSSLVSAAPPSPAFTYQGHLIRDGVPANGLYDFTFQAYGQVLGGLPFDAPVTNLAVVVSNGLFTTLLDLGSPDARFEAWLEIGVRSNGQATAFTPLAPRQLITPTPFALFADRAGEATNALSVAPAAVTGPMIAIGAISGTHIADDQVVRSLNDLQDVVRLVPGTNVSISVSGQDVRISATPGTVVTNAGWSLTGNSGTGPANFLGTLDGTALELRVNAARALRLEPSGLSSANVIGGYSGNTVVAGVAGATIAGGGGRNFLLTSPNIVGATYGTIGGGALNTIAANATASVISGGNLNGIQIDSQQATISGGTGNTINTNAVGGVVGGGARNTLRTDAQASTIGGGEENTIGTATRHGVIGGGATNLVGNGAAAGTVSGGAFNTIMTDTLHGTIGGGRGNLLGARAEGSTISGGRDNSVHSGLLEATVGGGSGNLIDSGSQATIAGGRNNVADGNFASVLGGSGNRSAGHGSTVGGGSSNESTEEYASVLGGLGNQAPGRWATIGGGAFNRAPGKDATVGAGRDNLAGGEGATVPGGMLNAAQGNYSFAAGYRAKANHVGSFVWADSQPADYASVAANTFNVRASGGVHLGNTLNVRSDSNLGVPHLRLEETQEGDFARLELKSGSRPYWHIAVGGSQNQMNFYNSTNGDVMSLSQDGTLFTRVLTITGGADLAEPFDMPADIGPGSVVVIDSEHAGRLKLSEQAYDKKVAGVVSGANGVRPGLTLSQQGTLEGTRQVALTGRVYVQADAGPGPIEPGDLLTTSDTPGHARKVTDHAKAQGAILGKAMTRLDQGQGLVLVLVSLQ